MENEITLGVCVIALDVGSMLELYDGGVTWLSCFCGEVGLGDINFDFFRDDRL